MKDVVNMVGNLSLNGTPKNQHESGGSKQGNKKQKKNGNKNFGPKKDNKFKRDNQPKGGTGGKLTCKFCKSPMHLQKNCPGFKEWLKTQGIPYDPNYKKGEAKPKSG
ncbi:unnamed protein product [Urochloa humidicola]